MFPNPQDALPLPPRPSLERYRKLAKDLVKACKEAGEPGSTSGGADSVSAWAEEWAGAWIDALVRLSGIQLDPQLPVRVERWIDDVAGFAQRQLAGNERRCALADAQFVIARSHGFESWPKFARCLDALAHGAASSESRFESAADATVAGDAAALNRLLREEPALIRMRSMREHGATLLHYVSANGIEGYRQRTPRNIVEIAELLLEAGADVNATANVYGGGCMTLGLTATSLHPERAGVQEELMRTLLEHEAKIDERLVNSCLANGRAQAAEFIAGRAARLDLDEAAGVGRLDLVRETFAADGGLQSIFGMEEWKREFWYACQFGRNAVIEYLLDVGFDPAMADGDGQTGLHHAVIGGNPEGVALLLKHKPPLEATNIYGGTVLGQALWSAAHGGDVESYIAILEALTDAGARLPERHVPVNARIDAWLEARGSHAEHGWYWGGERPRAGRGKTG